MIRGGVLQNKASRIWAVALVALALCAAAPATQAHANPLDAIASFFGVGAAEQAEPAAGTDLGTDIVVDGDTKGDWENWAKDNTQNIGRIWTDKSVYKESVTLPGGSSPEVAIGDSDFLVGLSAISSMSNTTTTTATPLDIVLVLDTSGSMGDRTQEVYLSELDKGLTYTMPGILSNRNVYWNENRQAWGYDAGLIGTRFEEVNPKTSSSSRGDQLYRSAMTDLQEASRGFVNKTLEANATIPDDAKKHRIAVVSFSSGAETRSGFTVVSDQGANELGNTLTGLRADGATEADAGFGQAQNVLNSARDNAKKAVLFFTDGAPGQSGFDGNTANSAIDIASSMKADTLIYSVGTFAGANAGDTRGEENAFMNAVSSNYPDATSYTNLGQRVDSTKNYYYAVTEDQNLSSIFEQIFEEVNNATGSPTEIHSGNPATDDGYITFTDQLGAYMQVDEFKSVVFADKVFNLDSKETGDPNSDNPVDTYKFSGTAGNAIYPDGNLSDLIIEVTRSKKPEVGDKVVVKIPASLIPLRYFEVYPDAEKPSSVTETYPIRIYFGVSPKDGVDKLLANPDKAMLDYIAANNDADAGTVAFYSNAWSGRDTGDTIANFEPATGNSYYYFTENTPIYTDETCNTPATQIVPGVTYWYQRTYHDIKNGKAEEKTAQYRFDGGSAVAVSGAVAYNNDGTAYFTAGAPRLTYIEELSEQKIDNATATAKDVINPQWNNDDSVNAATHINVSLGNNGRIDAELPGALAVSKTVEAPASYGDAFNDVSFDFDIELTIGNQPFDGKVHADVMRANGELSGEFELQFQNGKATHAIKTGETLYVYGLPEGAQYKVTEQAKAGFKVDPAEITGAIAAGEVAQADFVNTYVPTPITVRTDELFTAQKVLDGRDWRDTDEFEFRMRNQDDAPMPDGAEDGNGYKYVSTTVGENDANNITFGNITFVEPGVHTYNVREFPDARIPGITYTNMRYRVTVTVTDKDLNGAIEKDEIAVEMHQITDDRGQELADPQKIDNKIAVFTNKYAVGAEESGPMGVKVLTGRPLKPGEFTFTVTSQTDGAPIPERYDTEGPDGTKDGKINKGESFVVGHASGSGIDFGRARLSAANLGDTYTYTVKENIPDDAVQDQTTGKWKKDGTTYDSTEWTITLTVTETTGPDNTAELQPVWTYAYPGAPTGDDAPRQVRFNNVYAPEPAVLTDDTLIKGSKTIDGRELLDGETFGFTLVGADAATRAAMTDGTIDGLSTNGEAKKVVAATKDAPSFNFGEAKFNKAGTYRFRVAETDWNGAPIPGNEKGLTFDQTVYTVTVKVTDNGKGQLEAGTTYVKGDGTSADQANFVNVYEASSTLNDMVSGGIPVSKTMTGRNMSASEFHFIIKGVNGVAGNQGIAASADEAQAKLDALADGETSFYNAAQAAGSKWTTTKLAGMTFTEKDAGKTFSFVVDEDLPADADAKGGVTYDQSEFRVDIAIADKGDGTLSADVTTTRIKDANGGSVNDPAAEVAFVNSYKADKVTYNPDTELETLLYKRLTGRNWKGADKFQFNIEPMNNAPHNANNSVTITGNDAWDATHREAIKLGSITFTAAGTYQYKVTEVEPAEVDKIPGITYDKDEAIVTIVVTDNGKGELSATVANVEKGDFVNVYNSEVNFADMVDFKLSKTLENKELTAGSFKFALTATTQEAADKFDLDLNKPLEFNGPSKDGAAGEQVDMPSAVDEPLVFTTKDSGKTFTYKFNEVADSDNKTITFDNTMYELTIKPTDNGDGTITVVTTLKTFEGDKLVDEKTENTANGNKPSIHLPFVNTYKPTASSGTVTGLEFTKVLKGKDWTNESFSFVLDGADGAPMPADVDPDTGTKAVTVDAKTGKTEVDGVQLDSAKFGFGNIVYEEAGDYIYTVTEIDGKKDGYTYDTIPRTFTVHVEDQGGQLMATTAVTHPIFVNQYEAKLSYGPIHGGVTITKKLDGRNMAAKQFTFKVTPNSLEAAQLLNPTATDVASIAYDSPSAKIGEVATVTELFDDVIFDQSHINKTYGYTITEEAPQGSGYTCTSGDTFEVKIAVVDAGDGCLKATTTVTDKAGDAKQYVYESHVATTEFATVDFVNKYEATPVVIGGDGQVKINATKTLTGRDMTADEFGFTVYNVTNANGEPIQVATGSNAASMDGKPGTVTFSAIEFSSESLAADANESNADAKIDAATGAITYTYNYRVDETSGFGGDTGVSQGNKSFNLTVTVVDDNAGNLTATVGYPQGSNDALTFTNFYGEAAQATVQVNGVKNYNRPSGEGYKVPDIEGKFSFTLEGKDGAPMPAGAADGKMTVTNSAGNVDFGAIAYTMENVWGAPAVTNNAADAAGEDGIETTASQPREKVFTYTVAESGSVAGVDNDPVAVREFTVTVKDDGQGNITAEPSFGTDRAFTFTNSYTVNPGGGSLTGDGGFKVSKQLKGRTLAEGEFEFALTDAAGKVVASAKNAADGTVVMPSISFDKPGVYKYKLSEVAGKLGGVTYDATVYDVTATVEHPGEDAKALTVEWAVDGHKAGDELTFVNTYEAAPTSIVFNAAKVLKGRDLKDGEFEFTLSEGGKVLQTVKNDKNGQISFEPVAFDKPGEYEYAIAEVAGKDKAIAYDDTVYTVKVVVTDPGTGKLAIDCAYGDEGAPLFTNVFDSAPTPGPEPSDPPKTDDGSKDKLPGTGDDSLMAVAMCGAAGIAAVATGLFAAKRKRNDA